jgi:lipopolysaccharide transport system ATP-binding protein
MSDLSIRLQGLGKRYRLGSVEPYRTLRDALVRLASGRTDRKHRAQTIWALHDVSFDVRSGEVLGIIGRNGAGKSTLLKLLTRITRPDAGRIEVHGRIGALLEVGTGFHPELSGRDNIYMNGAILGMTRRDIDRRFDEIVAFSGVEPFLETPVKRYSSGMRVRLGFAIAAHLEPEILVIDEVLAVGDAEFQRKCLGRMNEVAGEGRTVLFVSHQMEAVQSLCTRAVWLQEGSVVRDGPTDDVIAEYLADTSTRLKTTPLAARTDRTGDGTCRLTAIAVDDGSGRPPRTGSPMQVAVTISTNGGSPNGHSLALRIPVRDSMDRLVTVLGNDLSGETLQARPGHSTLVCRLDRLPLTPGAYALDAALRCNGTLADKVFGAAQFDVLPGDFFGSGKTEQVGMLHVPHRWDTLP